MTELRLSENRLMTIFLIYSISVPTGRECVTVSDLERLRISLKKPRQEKLEENEENV